MEQMKNEEEISITSDPSFSRPPLLLCYLKDDDWFVSSIPQHTQNSNRSYSSSLSFDHHHMTKMPHIYSRFQSTESVHGLICFHNSENPIVWNPSTRKFITLPTIPRPCKDWNSLILFLGYDPIEGKHKVVCIPYKRNCYVFRVFTLGSAQESWRTVRTNRKHRSNMNTVGRCIQGVIYYIASTCGDRGYVVMSFDVRSEKFSMIKLPSGFRGDLLITYKGRLACFDDWDHRRFWILEDARENKWSSQDFLSSFGDCKPRTDLNLTGLTHAGEFIYVPENVGQSFYILICDPVRNSWRIFEFKGIADEVSFHNGGIKEEEEKEEEEEEGEEEEGEEEEEEGEEGEEEEEDEEDEEEERPYTLLAFPNHIYSQMSL